MKRNLKRMLFLTVAAVTSALSGCIPVGDSYLGFDGPRNVGKEKQTLVYMPKHQVEMSLEAVQWSIYDCPGNQEHSWEYIECTNDDNCIEGEWFRVYLEGGNVYVDLASNEGYKRSLEIYIHNTFTDGEISMISVDQDGLDYSSANRQ